MSVGGRSRWVDDGGDGSSAATRWRLYPRDVPGCVFRSHASWSCPPTHAAALSMPMLAPVTLSVRAPPWHTTARRTRGGWCPPAIWVAPAREHVPSLGGTRPPLHAFRRGCNGWRPRLAARLVVCAARPLPFEGRPACWCPSQALERGWLPLGSFSSGVGSGSRGGAETLRRLQKAYPPAGCPSCQTTAASVQEPSLLNRGRRRWGRPS